MPFAAATEVKVFRAGSQAAFLAGTLDGVSVDQLGALRLAQKVERIATLEEPFLFAAAEVDDGWVAVTGNSGRVIHIATDGRSRVLFETPEPEIFALLVDADGTVLVGSSPNGKVYSWQDRTLTEVFDPGETYIWDLARDTQGRLLVATGTEGRLYRVDGTSGEVLFDSEASHLRSLLPQPDGTTLVGTAGEGLLLQIDSDGQARTLHSADGPEIVALAPASEGGAWIAVLASEASLVELGPSSTNGGESSAEDNGEDEDGDVQISESSDTPPAGSRRSGFRGPRSRVLRYRPNAGISKVWDFEDETVFDLVERDGRLWVATGLEGKLYSLNDGQMVLEKDLEEAQIVSLFSAGDELGFASTNAAAVFRFTRGSERQGTLTSSVLDARQMARFGTLRWSGQEPSSTTVKFSLRSGMSKEPDATWSDWTAPASGREIALADLGQSRYLQWRLHLGSGNGSSPTVTGIEVSYLQSNQQPEIEVLEALAAGQILVPGNFNPANQVYEPAHPNRDGIFTEIGQPRRESNRNLKTLWKQGYRTLRWSASDPNDDELRYSLFFRREVDSDWLPMTTDLEEDRYSFDSTVLPDGEYRFRVVATDAAANARGEGLEAQKVSESVVVDHSPPQLGSVRNANAEIRAEVVDRLSPLRSAEFSTNATEWRSADAADGLLDGSTETIVLTPESNGKLLLLRVTDAAFNVITFDLSSNLP